MITPNTITLKGSGMSKELLAHEAITPGHLVSRTPTNTVEKHKIAGGQTQKSFAVENEIIGKGIDEAYTANNNVLMGIFPPGAEVYALLDVGTSVTYGSKLVSAGNGALKAAMQPGSVSVSTGTVSHYANSASRGTAIYAHIDDNAGAPFAHLESPNRGNADSVFSIGADGPVVVVRDDNAAAAAGLRVYYDEDAVDSDSRFLVNNTTTGKDIFVLASDGSAIRIVHSATAAATGVALQFDDDAANVAQRLVFVSPTTKSGSYTTDNEVSVLAQAGAEAVVAQAIENVDNNSGSTQVRCKIEII